MRNQSHILSLFPQLLNGIIYGVGGYVKKSAQ